VHLQRLPVINANKPDLFVQIPSCTVVHLCRVWLTTFSHTPTDTSDRPFTEQRSGSEVAKTRLYFTAASVHHDGNFTKLASRILQVTCQQNKISRALSATTTNRLKRPTCQLRELLLVDNVITKQILTVNSVQ